MNNSLQIAAILLGLGKLGGRLLALLPQVGNLLFSLLGRSRLLCQLLLRGLKVVPEQALIILIVLQFSAEDAAGHLLLLEGGLQIMFGGQRRIQLLPSSLLCLIRLLEGLRGLVQFLLEGCSFPGGYNKQTQIYSKSETLNPTAWPN